LEKLLILLTAVIEKLMFTVTEEKKYFISQEAVANWDFVAQAYLVKIAKPLNLLFKINKETF
jgi:hypothetical protein